MKRMPFVLALLAAASLQAHAIGHLSDITVVDRSNGQPLPLHYYRGEYWVAGTPGATYAISVRNKSGQRVLAVPSVDGVNVLSGQTASWDQSGYVLGAYQQYQITGWRKSDHEVAAFEFSDASDSYAARTGRPGHVGIIGVAVFEEQRGEPALAPEELSLPVAPSVAAPESGGRARSSAGETAAQNNQADSAARPSSPAGAIQPPKNLGTAHGQREASEVQQTTFVRRQTRPNELIRIRYASRESLIAQGVIRVPAARVPNAFPGSSSLSFAPDPPSRF